MSAQHSYSMVKSGLEQELKHAQDKLGTANSGKAAATEAQSKAEGELAETSKTKAADEEFAATLKGECETKATEWAERQKSANEEMAVIEKAKEILTSGVKAFVQMSTKSVKKWNPDADDEDDKTADRREKVVDILKDLASKHHSFALTQMASVAVSDPFVKIRGLIEDMIEKLLKEAQEEATQKAFCDKEMGTSKASKEKKTMTLDKLNSRIDKASARVAELEEAIKTLSDEIATLDAATAEATKIRNEEAASNAKAIKDFGDAAAATEKAIKILKDFYDNAALIQTSSKTHSKDDAPEFGSAKSGAGDTII